MVELESSKEDNGSNNYFSGVEETIESTRKEIQQTTSRRGPEEKSTKFKEVVSLFYFDKFVILFLESVKNTKLNISILALFQFSTMPSESIYLYREQLTMQCNVKTHRYTKEFMIMVWCNVKIFHYKQSKPYGITRYENCQKPLKQMQNLGYYNDATLCRVCKSFFFYRSKSNLNYINRYFSNYTHLIR